jgi:hypothetical protein
MAGMSVLGVHICFVRYVCDFRAVIYPFIPMVCSSLSVTSRSNAYESTRHPIEMLMTKEQKKTRKLTVHDIP